MCVSSAAAGSAYGLERGRSVQGAALCCLRTGMPSPLSPEPCDAPALGPEPTAEQAPAVCVRALGEQWVSGQACSGPGTEAWRPCPLLPPLRSGPHGPRSPQRPQPGPSPGCKPGLQNHSGPGLAPTGLLICFLAGGGLAASSPEPLHGLFCPGKSTVASGASPGLATR